MENNHLIIMAGGVGSRFWPMSTPECPKQFIDITGCGKTMIQQTIERFGDLVSIENVWVVTSKKYKDIVKAQLPKIPESNILLEPCMRNTAPCIAYVSSKIYSKYPDANLIITPSDHIVTNPTEFQRIIAKGIDFINEADRILTLGINVSRPETGYGYIQGGNTSDQDNEVFKVEAFKEKPNVETAKKYIEEGNYFWNSGLFLWNVKTVVNSLRAYVPEIMEIFDEVEPYFYTEKEQEIIDEKFPMCKAISIDYAVMEKASNIYVLPADFGWSDLGTWGSLHTLVESDNNLNSVIGDSVKMIESDNCMVHLPSGKKAVLQGLKGYIVAEKDGVLMVCKMSDEQRIKEFSVL